MSGWEPAHTPSRKGDNIDDNLLFIKLYYLILRLSQSVNIF